MRRIRWAVCFCVVMVCSAGARTSAQSIAASAEDMARCADWIHLAVPLKLGVDAKAFCAGIKPPDSADGFYSVQRCGPGLEKDANDARSYCAWSGILGSDWTISAGYIAGSGKGQEFFTEWDKGNSVGAAATLYTRTPLRMGTLRVPAGFYGIMPLKPGGAWKLAITRDGRSLGSVNLKTDSEHVTSTADGLAMTLYSSSVRCGDPVNTRELIFTYGGRDLYTCLVPEPIPPAQQQTAAK